MFSRGNITEKARILGQGARFDGLHEQSLKGEKVQDISVVDMYAGIGYFVFSYLKRGVRRVWGFEINGWSVEGLHRGCTKNGWGCKVVRINEDGALEGGLQKLVNELDDADRVVIFHGDNKFAADILKHVRELMELRGSWNSVRHVNLGLLPTSKPAYECAYRLLDRRYGGWAHVHENVDIRQIDEKKKDILGEFKSLASRLDKGSMSPSLVNVQCQHVEQVKSYAPGVMHCVFDVEFTFEDS
jgi:Predicted methyltransferase